MADAKRETSDNGENGPADVEAADEYARGVHRETLDFNRDLYTRAQIVLTLNGVLLGAVGAGLASNPDSVSKILRRFSWLTWIFLTLATAALLVSVFSATAALYSRHRKPSVTPGSHPDYGPRNMWFYASIAQLPNDDFVNAALRGTQTDPNFEARVRLAEVAIMSKIMVRRANRLNLAFVGIGVALGFFALAAVDYLILLG